MQNEFLKDPYQHFGTLWRKKVSVITHNFLSFVQQDMWMVMISQTRWKNGTTF